LPQDTIYTTINYPNGVSVTHQTLEPVSDSQMHEWMKWEPPIINEKDEPLPTGSIISIVVMGLIIFFPILRSLFTPLFGRLRYTRTWFFSRKKLNKVNEILTSHFKYFRNLPEDKKDDFVRRVILFKKSIKFKFKDIPREPHICYLISASAIQLTFGLKNYLLTHFNTIHILAGEYKHFAYAIPFQGHTSDGEIYFSWPHFQYGYSIDNDKNNLGLHEMAHALTWQCFYSGGTGDTHFRNTFASFSAVGRPLFARMQQGERNILGDYAATNYDEFWATSVEVFFEQPIQMKRELPNLYDALCLLLRQDPASA
jgi:MtfA peptidase